MHKYCSSVLLLKNFPFEICIRKQRGIFAPSTTRVCMESTSAGKNKYYSRLIRICVVAVSAAAVNFCSFLFSFLLFCMLAMFNMTVLSLSLVVLSTSLSNRFQSLSVSLVYKSKMKSLRMEMWMPNPLFSSFARSPFLCATV